MVAAIASTLPLLCGWLLCAGFLRPRMTALDCVALLAPGAVIGWALVALGMKLFAGFANGHTITAAALLLIACSSFVAFSLSRSPSGEPHARADMGLSQRVIWLLLLGLIVVGLWLAFGEMVQRPLYSWDAWSAWAIKARVWFELGQGIEFVGPAEWLATDSPAYHSNHAWHYPDTLPLIQLWMLRWAGMWDENLINIPAWQLAVACMASTYAIARCRGAQPLPSIILCYALATLPLLNGHLALAGYADIWVACGLWTVALCVTWSLAQAADQNAHQTSPSIIHARRWLCLALPGLLLVASVKREGLVWVTIGVAGLIWLLLNRRWRRVAIATVFVAIAVLLLLGGIDVELPLIGRLALLPHEIAVPYLGSYPLAFSNQLPAFVEGLLFDPNWHLLWYVLPLVAPFLLWHFRHRRLAALVSVVSGLSAAFLLLLFFFSGAAVWAESMTASNRLVLQITPMLAVMFGWLLLDYDLERDTNSR